MNTQGAYRQQVTGPYHDFWLCPADLDYNQGWHQFVGLKSSVRLSNDIFTYCADSLSWIPCINPATNRALQGLNWYGPSVITKDEISTFHQVIIAWSILFSQGPSEMILNCGY